VRGRLWIGLLAFSLIGIVAMQLMVLKLNNGIGATLQRAATLQRTNAQLGIEAATGSGEGRIEPLAAATGMTFAPPGSVHFVASSSAADIARAAAVLAAPIQPHEYAASAAEAAGGEASPSAGSVSGAGEAVSSEAPSGGRSGSGESASASSSGESASGSGEAPGSTPHPSEEAHAAGAGEASASSQSHGAEAGSAATTGVSEASASAAGGVAAGH
jgi:hypothetical protein